MKRILAIAAICILGACATPERPEQMVYQAKAAYGVALSQAVAYKELPACAEAPVALCHDPAIVKQSQLAQAAARPALDAAEAAVRTGLTEDVKLAAAKAAQYALAAFQKVLDAYIAKKGGQ